MSAAQGPVNAANRFVANLDDGDPQAAYQLLCPETQMEIPFDTFVEDMARAGEITDYTLTAVSVGSSRPALVTGTVSLSEQPRNVGFTMRRFGDQWLVCGYDRLN